MNKSTIYYLCWMQPLLEKIETYHNNPKKYQQLKYTASGYSLFTHCSFDATKINLVITETKIV